MAIQARPDVQQGLRAASPALVMLGRAGYAAKGIVYVVMGALAAKVALGTGGKTTDTRGAIGVIGDGPMGTIALVAIGVGLLGYMLWRLIAAATDAEGEGSEPTKLVVRAAQAGRGIAYGVLGVQALRALGGDDVGSPRNDLSGACSCNVMGAEPTRPSALLVAFGALALTARRRSHRRKR